MLTKMNGRGHRAIALAAATTLVVIAGACGEATRTTNTLADKSAPSVVLSSSGSSVDTVSLFRWTRKTTWASRPFP